MYSKRCFAKNFQGQFVELNSAFYCITYSWFSSAIVAEVEGYDKYNEFIIKSDLFVYSFSELIKTSIESSKTIGKFSWPIWVFLFESSKPIKFCDFYEFIFETANRNSFRQFFYSCIWSNSQHS